MTGMIPYGRQLIEEDDIAAVAEVLASDYLTSGPKVDEFERELARYTGAKYAVAVANGTAALHLAVLALSLPPGSEGIVPAITFAATANSLLYNSLRPRFADIDSRTVNVTDGCIERIISAKTKVVLPVHFSGRACDMEAIGRLAQRHQSFVIEDAAHALGALYSDGSKVGCCHRSDLTIFSFHPVKAITTGEGGAIMTNNADLYRTLLRLRNHGIVKDPASYIRSDLAFSDDAANPWYYEVQGEGFNYRLPDINAALGISQLKKLDRFIGRRRRIAAFYDDRLGGISGVEVPPPDQKSAYHLYALQVDFGSKRTTRRRCMERLRELGIGTQVHYIPLPLLPRFSSYGSVETCPTAAGVYDRLLSIPIAPIMTDEQVETVVSKIRQVLA